MKNERRRFSPRFRAIASMLLLAAFPGGGLASGEEPPVGVPQTAAGQPAEAGLEPFLGEPRFDVQPLFRGQRFPNVVVATDGTVIATWGGRPTDHSYKVRRSEDGGDTWQPEMTVAEPGFHGGGALVDERSGDVFVFVDDAHPPRTPQKTLQGLEVYRSKDHGKTWERVDVTIHPDTHGNVPARHMAEAGITLRHGPKAGRLLRPARVYYGNVGAHPRGYNTAIYSDDGGTIWRPSAPFPALGTGEGALAELSDGRIYYNSRRHWAPEGVNARMRWTAYSEDGGETWNELSVSDVLPDGAQHRDYGLMAGLVRLPVRERDILVFSNIVSPRGRHNGHVWASFDGGRTWPIRRQIEDGGFAYSSLAAGRPGTTSEGWIYLLFEADGHPDSNGHIARFNLAWLLDGEPTGDGQPPNLP